MKRAGRSKRAKALSRTHTVRCRTLCAIVVVVGGLMGGRAFQLQVVQGEHWRNRAVDQTTARTELPAVRGGLYDRNGRPLSVSQEEYLVFYAPAEDADRDQTLTTARQILDLSRRDIDRLRGASGGWLPLGRVRASVRDRLAEALPRAIHFESVPARVYPEGRLATALLGVVDSEGNGLSGLELLFDSLLAGTPGEQLSRRDAHGRLFPLRHAANVPPRPGRDVFLTIDAELQEIAEAALASAMAETGAAGGDVILADPRTGEILALASRSGDGGYRVPALTDPYEPGSTAKAVLLATLLQEDLASLDEPIDVEGGQYRTPYRTITDVHGYDTLSVSEVVLYSSNIGAAKLADRIDRGLQYSYLRDFGFGTPTGIEATSEAGGRLRRPSEWSKLSQHSLAYGYELTVTSIQLVAAYGALANGGVLMRPTLLGEIRDADGVVTFSSRPQAVRRVIDQSVAGEITRVLTDVVREGGTGDEAALRTIDIAGKTGTSRVSKDGAYGSGKYVASFVGYLPADDPQLVVLAKLDDPKSSIYGGGVAAPVTRAVLQATLAAEESGIASGRIPRGSAPRFDWGDSPTEPLAGTTPFRFATSDIPTVDPAPPHPRGDVIIPDVGGMSLRDAVNRLYEAGLEVELAGSASDLVRRSEPAAGARAVPGARVLLR